MNKAYRLIWSATKNLWVVAAELVTGKGGPPPVSATARVTLDAPDSASAATEGWRNRPASTAHTMPLSCFVMALEPRFMFDAAGAATVDALVDRSHDAVPAPIVDKTVSDTHAVTFDFSDALSKTLVKSVVDVPAVAVGVEVAFVDSRVPDAQALIAGMKPGVQVVMLDPAKDGIAQITQALQNAGTV